MFLTQQREEKFSMGLKNGSDEYWEIKEHAKRLYDKRANAHSSTEREKCENRCKEYADRLIEDYGHDETILYIIKQYLK